jgi:hypothetical protein
VFSFKKSKILVYVLVFDQYDIIKQSLDFLTSFSDRLDIVVIENPSPSSPKIGRLIESYGKSGLIKRYYFFDKNITGYAFALVLDKERDTVNRYKLTMLTDGDLTTKDVGWLDEEISILDKNPDVYACGVSLDKSNLPLEAFPEAKDWVPPDISIQDDYYEGRTGAHMLLLSSTDLLDFLDFQQERKVPFVDSSMHYYCYNELHKKWARTKNSTVYHLTWDLYKDPNHPYTKLKTQKSHEDTWYHQETSNYKFKEY